jgi:thiamine biosynthesis lipoprotein
MKPWTAELPFQGIRKASAALVAGAFLFLLAWFFRDAGPRQQVFELQGRTMGTTWSLQVVLPAASAPDSALADAASSLLAYLDRGVFSTYTPDSELMQLNAAPIGTAFPVSDDLLAVLSLAAVIHESSAHAFDPTVGPLVRLWGFGPGVTAADLPAEAQIAGAMSRLGMDSLVMDADAKSVQRLQDIELDLSAIAKGYAVDRLAAITEMAGHDNYLVEIGGELRVSGSGPQGQGWTVAIEKPDPGVQRPQRVVNSRNLPLALAGSGDYRNFRIVDGQRYSHEIDPRTGRPVTHDLAAVTVLASDAATADAWATALMVLGPEEGMLRAEQNAVAAYFIMHEGDGFRTKGSSAMQALYPEL